jgi:uncharacterized protein (DUF885 family)
MPLLLAAGCAGTSSTLNQPLKIEAGAQGVTRIADAYVNEFINSFPEEAFSAGLTLPNDGSLSDNSLVALSAWERKEDAWWSELQRIDGEALWGRPEWITYGLLREALEAQRGARVCRFELWPLNQISGWQAKFAALAASQPVGTLQRRTDAIARWRQLPRYLETEIANLKEGIRLGYTTPRRNVDLTLQQIDQLLALSPGDSPFYEAWAALLENEIQPAIRRYRDFVSKEYLSTTRTVPAVIALPGGSECYRASFRLQTTIERRPEDTHALGKRVVEGNESEIRAIGERVFGITDVTTLRTRIENDPSNRFTNAEDIQAHAAAATRRAREALPNWFGRLPKLGYSIEPIPDFLAASASPHYEPGARDGSRPGVYFINLYEPEKQLYSRNELIAFHEVYPGHHMQIALSQELPDVHSISHLIPLGSYVEGWGRYAEALAEEMGLYQSPHSAMWRRFWPARGMVVDTGLHALGWTREQAVQYITAGGSPVEPEALVDRLVVWPAQATAYDTGAIEILALRDQARRELGALFDLREFHDRVLAHGAITLPMLRRVIEHWIAEKKAKLH